MFNIFWEENYKKGGHISDRYAQVAVSLFSDVFDLLQIYVIKKFSLLSIVTNNDLSSFTCYAEFISRKCGC